MSNRSKILWWLLDRLQLVIGLIVIVLGGALHGCEAISPPCVSDQDCFVGEACVGTVCVTRGTIGDAGVQDADSGLPVDCRVDASVCGAKVCNTSTGDCIACGFDMQCGPGGVCDERSGTCFCESGKHRCGGTCVDNDSPLTCGSRCSACPGDDQGVSICDDGQCDILCDEGLLKCGADCNVSPKVCVECLSPSNCPQVRPVCDAGACAQCETDGDCSRFPTAKICEAGACVECTPSRRSACNQNSCNPATRTCTTTLIDSVDTCRTCVADEECLSDYRCVPMFYRGIKRPQAYCLKKAGTGRSCEDPYSVLVARVSLSRTQADNYCSPNEELVSCEAITSFGGPCTSASDCGLDGLNDGLCKPFPSEGNQCTYACQDGADCQMGGRCIGTPPDSSYCLPPLIR